MIRKHQYQIPGKIVLFGEWAVLKGHPALSIAVSQYCHTHVLPNRPGHFQWTTPRAMIQSAERPHTPSFLGRLVDLLWDEISAVQGLRLRTNFEWNLNFGLGSSSALILSLVKALADAVEQPLPISDLWLKCRDLQRRIQHGRASGIDLGAQILGGAVQVAGDLLTRVELKIPDEIFFLHSGKKHSTSLALQSEIPMDSLRILGESCARFLSHQDWAREIKTHYEVFSKLNRLDSDVLRMADAVSSSEVFLKPCGAGGSETVMVHAPRSQHLEIEARAAKLGFTSQRYSIAENGIL
jgi:mevalonate kinase